MPSKTWVVGAILTVLGVLKTFFGIEIPTEQIEALLNNIVNDATGIYSLVAGALVIWFRSVADHPLVKNWKGFFLGQKEKA